MAAMTIIITFLPHLRADIFMRDLGFASRS
jgi:hypothetical protein